MFFFYKVTIPFSYLKKFIPKCQLYSSKKKKLKKKLTAIYACQKATGHPITWG